MYGKSLELVRDFQLEPHVAQLYSFWWQKCSIKRGDARFRVYVLMMKGVKKVNAAIQDDGHTLYGPFVIYTQINLRLETDFLKIIYEVKWYIIRKSV